MSYERRVILNLVNSSSKILFWIKRLILLFVVPFLVGLLIDYPVAGCCISIFNIWAYKIYKKEKNNSLRVNHKISYIKVFGCFLDLEIFRLFLLINMLARRFTGRLYFGFVNLSRGMRAYSGKRVFPIFRRK